MSEMRQWEGSAPWVLTLENDWLRHDYEGDSQGQAIWVNGGDVWPQIILMAEQEGLSVGDACYDWARKAGVESGLNAELARPLSWEWRVQGPGSKQAALVALRCFSKEPLSAQEVLSRLGLRSLGELPCAGDRFSFVGSNMAGWLLAMRSITESQEIAAVAEPRGKKLKKPSL